MLKINNIAVQFLAMPPQRGQKGLFFVCGCSVSSRSRFVCGEHGGISMYNTPTDTNRFFQQNHITIIITWRGIRNIILLNVLIIRTFIVYLFLNIYLTKNKKTWD